MQNFVDRFCASKLCQWPLMITILMEKKLYETSVKQKTTITELKKCALEGTAAGHQLKSLGWSRNSAVTRLGDRCVYQNPEKHRG